MITMITKNDYIRDSFVKLHCLPLKREMGNFDEENFMRTRFVEKTLVLQILNY